MKDREILCPFLTASALSPLHGSSQTRPSGLEVGGLAAINFDADEGFEYGALAECYQYGGGALSP